MRLITCPKCSSQFDVSSMAAGTSFVCGKCRNVLEVPQAGPVVQPISPGASSPKGAMAPPPTVSLTPDQLRKALQASADVGATRSKPPAAAQPARQLPKAMQKRAQEAASQSAQRAGATGQLPATAAVPAAKPGGGKAKASSGKAASAGKTAAASKSGKSSKPARGASSGGEKKKSQAPLFAGIGAVVAVLAIVAFIATRGGGDAQTGPAGGSQETATAGNGGNGGAAVDGGAGGGNGSVQPPPVDPSDTVGVFLAKSAQEQRDDVARQVLAASSSADSLRALHEFFSNERMASSPVAKEARKSVADAALRLDGKLDWANEASGRKNLKDFLVACRDECTKSFGFAEEDEQKILDRLASADFENGSPWVDAAEFKEFESVVDRIRAREEELKNNPRLVQVEKQKDWIRNNDLFKGFEIVSRYEDPYVVFQQYPKMGEGMEHYDEGRMTKAKELARRDGVIFRELNNQFRNLFGERFELPKLGDKGRLLRVLIMWDRKDFDEWHRKQNSGIAGFVRAYYSPTERHIVHYVGTEALTEQDYWKCANGRVQKTSDQVTFHEGTHQLMHEYGAIYQGSPLPSSPDEERDVPPRRCMWFSEGLAEFMGAVEINESDMQSLGGEFFHNRILLERVAQARDSRKNRLPNWPLAKLIRPNHNGELLQMGEELMPGRGPFAANIFYAQSWAFVHFCWFYDNGKYRKNLLDYMECELKNEQGIDALVRTFNLPSADDFGIIEKEFDWYYNLLLRRLVGRKKTTGWYTPETDPPQGRYDPNASDDDGGDYDE